MNRQSIFGFSLRTFITVGTLLVLLGTTIPTGSAQGDNQNGPPEEITSERFHVYLLIGQSNMSGRGKMSAEHRVPKQHIYALDEQGLWKPASHPLHFDKPKIAGYGLGIEFAEEMLAQDEGVSIGLVPCAVGGTSLAKWKKGSKLYELAIARTKLALKRGTLKGIIWHQGEGDCNEPKAITYRKRLTRLIGNMRADLNSPNLPFVLGELGHFRIGVKRRSDIVIQQQQSVPIHVKNTACVSAAKLGHVGDRSHFDTAALREFGTRYAKSMITLQSNSDDEAEVAQGDSSVPQGSGLVFDKNDNLGSHEDAISSAGDRKQ